MDTCPIAIIDPALGRTGAHNRAFAERLADNGGMDAECGIWCHESLDDSLHRRLASAGIDVKPCFAVDFYQLFAKAGSVAEHWDWIHALTRQYREALRQVLVRWPSGPVRVLHHTVSWEHATALALAIELQSDREDRLEHDILLMYWPGIDVERRTVDAQRAFNFRQAFHSLDALPNTQLYAGCSEYAEAYATLLSRPAALPIHPCLVGDWQQSPCVRRASREGHERVLMHVGEIKQDKGFLQLPERLRTCLRHAPATRRFVVQFVEPRNAAARKVASELERLAGEHRNVEAHSGFWTETRLHEELAACDALCINYDAAAYAHKTSGLLWLAGWYRIPVIVPPDTWLEREARRLGLAVLDDDALTGTFRARPGGDDASYRQLLYTPFWHWLQRQGRAPWRAGAASLRALPRERGADIVVFWKQNDSTLYGRRVDMVVQYLASRSDVRRVIVVDAAIGKPNLEALARQTEPTHHGRAIYARTREKLAGQLDEGKVAYTSYVCPLKKYRFRDDGSGRPHFIGGYVEFLQQVFAREGVDPRRAVFWIYPRNFHAPALIRKFDPARVVIDVVDNDCAWPGVSDAARQRLTQNLAQLLSEADMAFANCKAVHESVAAIYPAVRLVPNGCDPHAHRRRERSVTLPASMHTRRKVIGFVGNLEAKIDIPLLHAVAERFAQCNVVLVGSTHANPQVRELARHSNVVMPGVVPYDQLGDWLDRFDVGLVPHLTMALTRYMNPLKVYVYLSHRIPVVATSVPNVDASASRLVHVAASHDEFLRMIDQQLRRRRQPARTFKAYVKPHRWQALLQPHVDALLGVEDHAARPHPPIGSKNGVRQPATVA